jgi:two-component system phosphate regulon sensor histidine kinase PhoR
MTGKPEIPWPGLIVAAIAAAVMPLAGASIWLALAIILLWTGSLFLFRREPPAIESAGGMSQADPREVLRQSIEPLDVSLILFRDERIVAANAAARTALGSHIVNQDARIALRHPDAVRLLELPDGGTVTVRGLTGARSLWQLTRHRIDERHWIIELVDRTAEADIGRAHTDFVANASHELRTPLAAIIGYVETLVDSAGEVDAATAAKFHQTVLREARRMESLVADLMSLSQLEAEKHDLPSEDLDLGSLIARVVGEFAARLGEGRVHFGAPSQGIIVTGDPGQLEQLLRNLIENGVKYGDSERGVDVALTSDDAGTACLVVADHGPGIAAEHLPHLTRRFYRTDPGRSRSGGGTGLGLAIVKHIVERHRGQLDIASVLGRGTTITVRLALAEMTEPALS